MGMLALLLVLQAATLSAQTTVSAIYDRVILGGRVMDPASRLDAVRNIGILDGRIAVITTQAVRGRDTIDARGLVVAPGFIDIHAHGQTPETYRYYSLDGVTTALELELGTSDVDSWYRERSAGERINYGVSIGHIKVRMLVMHDSGTVMPVGDGAYRAATPAQIGEIAKRIEIGLSEGAVDIGAGFPYTPAATREELLAVFRVAAKMKTPVCEPATACGRASSGAGRRFEPVRLSTAIFSGIGISSANTLESSASAIRPAMCIQNGRASRSSRR